MTFTEKVRAMTAKQIIMAMVEGLRKRHTVIDMGDFGYIKDGVCYGCAATNCIIEIDGGKEGLFPKGFGRRNCNYAIVSVFEKSIDALRKGYINTYNTYAREGSFAEIVDTVTYLPHLYDDYTEEDLQAYVNLANSQPS